MAPRCDARISATFLATIPEKAAFASMDCGASSSVRMIGFAFLLLDIVVSLGMTIGVDLLHFFR
jgi:hypothetical protein